MAEPDAELVRRVVEGETECFRALVERYQDAVFGVAFSRTGSFADAEDVAQETFLAAFEALHQLDEPGSFAGWLYRIAVNTASKRIRRDRRRNRRHESLPSPERPGMAPDEAAELRETRGEVLAAVRRLPEASREAATLYYIDGYSTADIGRFTGCPAGTIRRRLHDARKRLRKELVAMVEDELKKSRPGKQFTDRVLREIKHVRVWVTGKSEDVLLVTDSSGRSFWLSIEPVLAQAFQPWLTGAGSRDDTDIHTATVRALEVFGLKVARFALTEMKIVRLGLLELCGGQGGHEVECPAVDGINLALRADAEVLVAKELVDHIALKRNDGAPMTPAGAWRRARQQMKEHFRNVETVRFKDMSEVVSTLERDPDHREARIALTEAAHGFRWSPSRLKDNTDAMRTLQSWVTDREGTDLEGFAAGLLGAVCLWPLMKPERAMPYLEKAHKLRPADGKVAFDLATAYAMTGRTDAAFEVLEALQGKDVDTHGVPTAGDCGNLAGLWDDPRFRSIIGEPDRRCAKVMHIPQLHIVATTGVSPMQERTRRQETSATCRLTEGDVKAVEQLVGRRPLLHVEAVTALQQRREVPAEDDRCVGEPEGQLVLEVAGTRAAAMHLEWQQASLLRMVQHRDAARQPQTPLALYSILDDAGIKLVAAVLTEQGPQGVEGALAVSRGGDQQSVTIAGGAAVAMALAGERPILITEALAEKLYVRGKSGKPLTPKGALRRLKSD